MIYQKYYNLFESQRFTDEEENIVLYNNMLIDYFFGHRKVIEHFANERPEYQDTLQSILNMSLQKQKEEIDKAKKKSLLMTVIMMTGRCNANCTICFTNRKLKSPELTFMEIKSIIDQTYDLGSRLLYIPGEGEPMLDESFWKTLEYAGDKGLAIVLFTNGVILSNNKESLKTWSMSSKEIVEKLKNYPVYIYHKYWSSNPSQMTQMMRINKSDYKFTTVKIKGESFIIPQGIETLLETFPLDRVGIETVIEKKNYDQIIEVIIPFVVASGVKSYIEPIIHAGRCFGIFEHDPIIEAEKQRVLDPWISRQNCRRVSYKLVVHNNGYISHGMAITPEQIAPLDKVEEFSIRNQNCNLIDLYHKIHNNPYLVNFRYQIGGCICERINLQLSKKPIV